MVVTLLMIIGVVVIRTIEFYLFMRKLTKICFKYDWKYINKNPMCLIDKMKNKDTYYLTSEWSAYNFLYLKGPSPKQMFFSLRPLRIETQYNEQKVNRLKEYEVI